MAIQAAAYTDLTALARLRGEAAKSAPAALREAAGQFEALLVQSMLKSMRSVSFSKGMFDNETMGMYRDMLDQQLSLELSNGRGRGLGLADMIVRQLGGESSTPPPVSLASMSVRKGRVPTGPAMEVVGSAMQVVGSAKQVAGSAKDFVGSTKEFVQSLWPHARDAARKLGVSAHALLAQAALETGWGRHVPSRPDGSPSFNLFGIKAGSSWRGDSVSVPTLEFDNDVARRAQARFRAYGSVAASFDDYAALISGDPRYADVLARGDDVAGFGQALQDAGYATDPAYGHKIQALAESEQMREALAGLDE